jgi:lactate dehydrogenase-like 2-hydroxyacid dehydrogenase
VVDQQALVSLLIDGALGGAGLDVLEGEPQVPDALRKLDQVVLTPHTASATYETRQDMARLVADNALSFVKTGRLLTPID